MLSNPSSAPRISAGRWYRAAAGCCSISAFPASSVKRPGRAGLIVWKLTRCGPNMRAAMPPIWHFSAPNKAAARLKEHCIHAHRDKDQHHDNNSDFNDRMHGASAGWVFAYQTKSRPVLSIPARSIPAQSIPPDRPAFGQPALPDRKKSGEGDWRSVSGKKP